MDRLPLPLLDNRVTENFSKIPGLGDVPLLASFPKSKSEQDKERLLVLVTPRVLNASAGQPPAVLPFPRTFCSHHSGETEFEPAK